MKPDHPARDPQPPAKRAGRSASDPARPALSEVRAALSLGLPGATAAHDVADRIRSYLPGFAAAIAAEESYRDREIAAAAAAGIRHFVVVYPDLPPSRLAHQVVAASLPAETTMRVLYVTADSGVRTRIVASGTGGSRVMLLDPTDIGIDLCIPAAGFAVGEPITVLLGSTLQHRHDPGHLIDRLWRQLPRGSRVSTTQIIEEKPDSPTAVRLRYVADELAICTGTALSRRSGAETKALFNRWEIVHHEITRPILRQRIPADDPVSIVDTSVPVMNLSARSTIGSRS